MTNSGTAAPATVVNALDDLAGTGAYVATIGRFDGVHRGHQHLIGLAVASARRQGLRSLGVTFEPHPEQLLRPADAAPRLTCPEEKEALLARTGLDVVAVLPFTVQFSRQQPEEFIDALVAATQLRELWIGEDFALGYRRAGTPTRLTQLGAERGFTVHTVPRIRLPTGETLASTAIRRAVQTGDVALAARLLGRWFRSRGVVLHGAKRGRELGYPTANLAPQPGLVLPAMGIYATLARVPGEEAPLVAMTSIGVRPVFDNGELLVESHLLDWSGDLYGKVLSLDFLSWLRPELPFPSVDALIEQIGHDRERAIEEARRVGAGGRP